MHDLFGNGRSARTRVQKGVLASDLYKQRQENPQPLAKPVATVSGLHATTALMSMRPFASRYQREHGERAYRQLLQRLFAELFPAE